MYYDVRIYLLKGGAGGRGVGGIRETDEIRSNSLGWEKGEKGLRMGEGNRGEGPIYYTQPNEERGEGQSWEPTERSKSEISLNEADSQRVRSRIDSRRR